MNDTKARDFVEHGLHAEIARLHAEIARLNKRLSSYEQLMIEAVDNCETCKGETHPLKLCARCQSFHMAIGDISKWR